MCLFLPKCAVFQSKQRKCKSRTRVLRLTGPPCCAPCYLPSSTHCLGRRGAILNEVAAPHGAQSKCFARFWNQRRLVRCTVTLFKPPSSYFLKVLFELGVIEWGWAHCTRLSLKQGCDVSVVRSMIEVSPIKQADIRKARKQIVEWTSRHHSHHLKCSELKVKFWVHWKKCFHYYSTSKYFPCHRFFLYIKVDPLCDLFLLVSFFF